MSKIVSCLVVIAVAIVGCKPRKNSANAALESSTLATKFAQDPLTAKVASVADAMTQDNDKAGAIANQIKNKYSLRAFTMNLGLLEARFRPVVGSIPYSVAYVPDYNLRSANLERILGAYIDANQFDVVFLQEVWHSNDVNTIFKIAAAKGYVAINPTYNSIYNVNFRANIDNEHGLMILVRRAILRIDDKSSIEETEFTRGKSNATKETAVIGMVRGIISTSITVKTPDGNGRKIFLVNSHFPYLLSDSSSRLVFIDQITELVKRKRGHFHYVLVGGDFNSTDVFDSSVDTVKTNYYKDKQVYLNLYDNFKSMKINLIDGYRVKNPDSAGYTQDRRHNPLTYFSDTCKDEPEQRIDYIWFGSGEPDSDQFYVNSSQVNFTSVVKSISGSPLAATEYGTPPKAQDGAFDINNRPKDAGKGGELFLSDHFGVQSKIELFYR